MRTRKKRLAVSFDCWLQLYIDISPAPALVYDQTYVFNSSGKGSTPASLNGSSTKLTFVTWMAGILFCKRHSSDHSGMASSSSRTSKPVLETWPRYSVSQPDGASSEMTIEVLGGMGSVGASLDGGGVIGPARSA